MNTTTPCRREETALCQPDRTIIAKKPHTPVAAPECATMSEKQFLRDHTMYSAISSWLFAIAGATNSGVLCAFAAKVLTAAEQGTPIFKSNNPAVKAALGNKKYNRIALGMMAFGGVCMTVSNWLESKKVVTEWQLGAGKLQRKANIADDRAQKASADQASASDAPAAAPEPKNWVASVQPKAPDTIERVANCFRP
jgi:hypothetical protein